MHHVGVLPKLWSMIYVLIEYLVSHIETTFIFPVRQ